MIIQGNVLTSGSVPAQASGAQNVSATLDRQGAIAVSELNGRYAALSQAGKLFMAQAIVTAPVIFSTAAGTGGPLLWNPPGSGVNGQILAVGLGVTTVTTVAAALGLTGGTGQSVAPTTTTAIDGSGNLLIGGAVSKITPFRIGTVATAGAFLLPFSHLHTGALTVDTFGINWLDLGGIMTFAPGSWASVAASATASTTVATIALVWTENPV